MKKLTIGCVVILVFSIFLFSDATLRFKETRVDFGKIDEEKTAEFTFEFENAGDSLLVIDNVIPSCGCTTVELKKKEYKPGEKGTIPVKFKGKGYHGRVTKAITVQSNDPKNRSFRLLLTGEIMVKNFSFPKVETEKIDFGDIEAGKEYTKKITISNIGTIDLVFKEVIHYPDIVPIFKDYTINPKGSTELTLRMRALKPGPMHKWIRILTNSIKKRYILIRLNGNIQ